MAKFDRAQLHIDHTNMNVADEYFDEFSSPIITSEKMRTTA